MQNAEVPDVAVGDERNGLSNELGHVSGGGGVLFFVVGGGGLFESLSVFGQKSKFENCYPGVEKRMT